MKEYDVISETPIGIYEELPAHFLADTLEEAEVLYEEYERMLNIIAYNYSVATGLNKADLFGEALVGLARAKRDHDPSRGDLKALVLRKVKDALNDFVRTFSNTVKVPRYIREAHKYINVINSETDAYTRSKAQKYLDNLAKNSGTTTESLINRASVIPTDTDSYDLIMDTGEEELEAALVVERLKDFMDEDDLKIAEGIMAGRTYTEIGLSFGRSPGWVYKRVKALKERILKEVKNE